MIKLDRIVFAVAACISVSVAPWQEAVAQPSAVRPMQDAQRKAEQKARAAQKQDDQQARAQSEAQKPDSAKPASAP